MAAWWGSVVLLDSYVNQQFLNTVPGSVLNSVLDSALQSVQPFG
jgi:hypothetical protein